MMKDHVFGHGTTLSVPGSPDHSKHKGFSKRSGRGFLGEEQAQDSEMCSEEDFVWWTQRQERLFRRQ